ncbi:DNA polymerase IV [Pseudarthrobacter sp. J1738]|uniref:DNA polymerase IV n=1 Tax=unclassified Pseudarthrobacter TaxID=2647000 RepID=UPI003D2D7CDA
MDAFFVSVELRERPELVGKPVIVGFPTGRSVVLSASYSARKLGVKSAMPMAVAMRMAPTAVVIEPRHSLYYEVSKQIMEIFHSVTDQVEQLSVDEAFLDVAGAIRRLGTPEEIGQMIRRRVATELGITASVGIAASKFVAKIASTRCKPDALLKIEPDQTITYLHSLPVSALWGVGAKSVETLARIGIRTVADVAATPPSSLKKLLGASGEHVYELAWGRDGRKVTPERTEKSIGAEETFSIDVHDVGRLKQELLRLSHRVGERLRSGGVAGRTVALKLRYEDFSLVSRSRSLTVPADNATQIYQTVCGLLDALTPLPQSVRLIGVRVESLESAGNGALQLSLDRRENNWRAAEAALDQAAARFGSAAVTPAKLMPKRNNKGQL